VKTLVLQPWQLTALQAGRLKSVWVPLEADKTCEHAARRGIDLLAMLQNWLPYAVGDVVEFVYHNRETNQFEFFRRKISAVSIRRVDSITEQEARDAGCQDGLTVFVFWGRYLVDHPGSGQWAVKVDLEAQT
jgi:hypothetical protein